MGHLRGSHHCPGHHPARRQGCCFVSLGSAAKLASLFFWKELFQFFLFINSPVLFLLEPPFRRRRLRGLRPPGPAMGPRRPRLLPVRGPRSRLPAPRSPLPAARCAAAARLRGSGPAGGGDALLWRRGARGWRGARRPQLGSARAGASAARPAPPRPSQPGPCAPPRLPLPGSRARPPGLGGAARRGARPRGPRRTRCRAAGRRVRTPGGARAAVPAARRPARGGAGRGGRGGRLGPSTRALSPPLLLCFNSRN